MRDADPVRLVLITVSGEPEAAAIARALVSERLAACVNIFGPIRSIYRWRGAIEDDREVLMLVKTVAPLLEALEKRIRALHSYEVPELMSISADSVSAPYLEWLCESVAAPKRAKSKRRKRA